MIFTNPSGAPELACDECGCRWFDRMSNSCYECGATVTAEAQEAFRLAALAHGLGRGGWPAGDTDAKRIEDPSA